MATEKLFEAIKEDDLKKFKWALGQSDVNIDHQQTDTGATALHLCLGKSGFVNELLRHKPRLDIFDKEGYTAFHIAAKYGFPEALFLLVAAGAKINAQKDNQSPVPLDLALDDDFTTTSRDYILFLGASLTLRAQETLDRETLDRHETVLQGYEAGKIIYEGKTLLAQESVDFEKLDVKVENLSDWSVDIFCRRMQAEYQDFEAFTPKIPLTTEDQYSEGKRNILENEELKSDIFHIKLNMSGTFKLTLPIHDKPRPHGFNREIQYAELIVKISHKTLGQDKVTATKAVYSHGKVVVSDVELGLEGQSLLLAVGVFLRTKTDHRTVNANTEETLASQYEEKFSVSTTENTFDKETDVALQVLKAKETPAGKDKAEEVIGHSDFCSALSSDKPAEDCITIQLPKPKVTTDSCTTIVMTCSQEDHGEREENWRPVDDNITETSEVVRIKKSGFGHYIVLAVKSLKKFGRKLKKLVSNLYANAIGKKAWCSLLVMTSRTDKLYRSANRTITILCVLCRFDKSDEKIEKYRRDNYEIQSCGKSNVFNVNTQKTYILTFEVFYAKLMTRVKQLPLNYQENHDNFQKVNVEVTESSRSPHVNVFLLNRRVKDTIIKEVAFGEYVAASVPVIFDVGNLREKPGEFLSDKILSKITKGLGDDWFEVLVGLGMPVMELKGLDMTNRFNSDLLMLKRWRDKHADRADRGLCALLSSLTRAARLDIRKMVVHYLNNYVQTIWQHDKGDGYRQNTFKQWLIGHVTDGNKIEIRLKPLLEESAMSPFDDSFLFYVSRWIVGEDIIPKSLGLKDSKYNDMRIINPPSRRMCQMLAVLKANQNEDPPCSFIRQLLNAIKERGNNLAVIEIEEKIRNWLKSDDPNFNPQEKEKIKQRLKIF